MRQVAGLAALHACQVGLGVVVLGEFGLDVGVDRGYFGLQGGQELGDGLVGAVLYFVPLEIREVVLYGSCSWCWSVGASWTCSRYAALLTVVHDLLLLDLVLIAFQQASQRVGYLVYHTLASSFQSGKLVRLLH